MVAAFIQTSDDFAASHLFVVHSVHLFFCIFRLAIWLDAELYFIAPVLPMCSDDEVESNPIAGS